MKFCDLIKIPEQMQRILEKLNIPSLYLTYWNVSCAPYQQAKILGVWNKVHEGHLKIVHLKFSWKS